VSREPASREAGAERADWAKSVFFAVLLVLGLFLWIPPLLRAMVGDGDQTAQSTSDGNVDSLQSDASPGDSHRSTRPTIITVSISPSADGRAIDRCSQPDPLTRPAEIAGRFATVLRTTWSSTAMEDGATRRSIPSPTNEAEPSLLATGIRGSAEISGFETDGIRLTNTIVGRSRKAAIVNGRLYREGDRIVACGESYRLTSVAEDRIELVAQHARTGQSSRRIIRINPEDGLSNPSAKVQP